jgi:hypothetical protein
MKYFPNAHGQESPIDDETRERRNGGPPLPSATRPTAGFAQPPGYGGATHAARIPASPPHGEASIWLASLGYYTVHLPKSFTLNIGHYPHIYACDGNDRHEAGTGDSTAQSGDDL